MHSHGPGGGLPPPPTRPTATHMHIINLAVGCHYFPPGLQLPSQPSGITALRPVPSYTAWRQRHIGVRNLPRVYTLWCPAETQTHDLLIASPTLYRNTTMPPSLLYQDVLLPFAPWSESFGSNRTVVNLLPGTFAPGLLVHVTICSANFNITRCFVFYCTRIVLVMCYCLHKCCCN